MSRTKSLFDDVRIDTGIKDPLRYNQQHLDELLKWASLNDVSDVTIQSGNFIYVERFGRLAPITHRQIPVAEANSIARVIYGDNASAQLAGGRDIDCSYEVRTGRNDLLRYRVNITSIRNTLERGVEITIRTIATTPPVLDSLNLPSEIRNTLVYEQGLVLITGPTGSGKTTLLAAIIRYLLEMPESHRKILTWESPIEYVYDAITRAHALIAQHEIGVHIDSFGEGVRNSLRRAPHIILVGEGRDADTLAAVIDAVMTGHLVYTTVHTNSVPETLRRMISAFPTDEKEGRLVDIIEALQTIVTQRLVRTTDGKRTAIREWLRFTPEIKDHILSQPTSLMVSATRQAVIDHGQPLGKDLRDLLEAGRIDEREYLLYRDIGTQSDEE